MGTVGVFQYIKKYSFFRPSISPKPDKWNKIYINLGCLGFGHKNRKVVWNKNIFLNFSKTSVKIM